MKYEMSTRKEEKHSSGILSIILNSMKQITLEDRYTLNSMLMSKNLTETMKLTIKSTE